MYCRYTITIKIDIPFLLVLEIFVKMCSICIFLPYKLCFFIIFIFIIILYICLSDGFNLKVSFDSLPKSLANCVSSENKTNKLNNTVDQKYDINIGIIPSSHPGDGGREFVCFLPLFLISLSLFLFCNTCPEYFFRKRIKVNKSRYIHVEKKCGCNYVYETTINP